MHWQQVHERAGITHFLQRDDVGLQGLERGRDVPEIVRGRGEVAEVVRGDPKRVLGARREVELADTDDGADDRGGDQGSSTQHRRRIDPRAPIVARNLPSRSRAKGQPSNSNRVTSTLIPRATLRSRGFSSLSGDVSRSWIE